MYCIIRVIFFIVFMNICDFLCLHENNKNIFNYIINYTYFFYINDVEYYEISKETFKGISKLYDELIK